MRALIVSLLAVLLALVGCSTAGDDGATPADGAAQATAGADQLAFVSALGRTDLRLAMVRPASFRPDEVTLADQGAVVIADLLYDGLTEIDGDRRTLEPGLSISWEADDGYRRWTFHLDPTNGVPADVVVRALGHLALEPGGDLPSANPAAALTAGMSAVTARDELTVEVTLERPNAGLPWVLSGLPFSIVGVDGTPTGDYEVVRDDPTSLRLRRQDRRGGPLGPSPDIEIVWTDEPEAAYRLLLDGAVNGAIVDPASLPDAERRFGFASSPGAAVRYYVLNPGSPQLADRDHRAALLGLVDADELVARAARPDLRAVDGLVSPSIVGYQPDSCGAACGELDDGTGGIPVAVAWPNEVALGVTYAGDGPAAVAEALADQLVAAGVAASPREASPRDLASAIVDGSPDLFAFGWVAPAGSVDAVLPPLLRGDSPANVARFASVGIEELLDAAASTGDDEARWAILDRAHRLALSEAKVLPVAASTGTMVVPVASGLTIRADGSLDLERSD